MRHLYKDAYLHRLQREAEHIRRHREQRHLHREATDTTGRGDSLKVLKLRTGLTSLNSQQTGEPGVRLQSTQTNSKKHLRGFTLNGHLLNNTESLEERPSAAPSRGRTSTRQGETVREGLDTAEPTNRDRQRVPSVTSAQLSMQVRMDTTETRTMSGERSEAQRPLIGRSSRHQFQDRQ